MRPQNPPNLLVPPCRFNMPSFTMLETCWVTVLSAAGVVWGGGDDDTEVNRPEACTEWLYIKPRVHVRFRDAVSSQADHLSADMVIAADGVHSTAK